jgi:hypothetical protein
MQTGVTNPSLSARRATEFSNDSDQEVAEYVAHVRRPLLLEGPKTGQGADELLAKVYEALTHRRFCALSRERGRRYRPAALEAFAASHRRGDPFEFWLDIGPGYHASLRPGTLPLSFEVGLAEFFMLTQIAAFLCSVDTIYPPGARFRLVVDNLCALRTNDVPVERTTEYCTGLRRLIHEMGLARRVRLFVESEEFDLDEYDSLLRHAKEPPLLRQASHAEVDNVARFLGRRCSPTEAVERMRLYRRTEATTECLMGRAVRGMRLTQRSTPTTLGFRSFPGGDARIQCGEVALGRRLDRGFGALLLTSQNIDLYECVRRSSGSPFPSTVRHITLVSHRA